MTWSASFSSPVLAQSEPEIHPSQKRLATSRNPVAKGCVLNVSLKAGNAHRLFPDLGRQKFSSKGTVLSSSGIVEG
jgi:hypothetical protein